jgi:hypothetical protein
MVVRATEGRRVTAIFIRPVSLTLRNSGGRCAGGAYSTAGGRAGDYLAVLNVATD